MTRTNMGRLNFRKVYYLLLGLVVLGFGLFTLIRGCEGCSCGGRGSDWVMLDEKTRTTTITGTAWWGDYRLADRLPTGCRADDGGYYEVGYVSDGFGDLYVADTVAVTIQLWQDITDGDMDYEITNVKLLGRKYGNEQR